jgi:hypothetical protein
VTDGVAEGVFETLGVAVDEREAVSVAPEERETSGVRDAVTVARTFGQRAIARSRRTYVKPHRKIASPRSPIANLTPREPPPPSGTMTDYDLPS